MTQKTWSTVARVNFDVWGRRDNVADYANRVLSPVEVVLLMRYQQALSGRVLDAGCGAGRILGYLVAHGGEVHGIDISSKMIDYCRQRYPKAHVQYGDLAALRQSVAGPFDAIIVANNTVDIFDDSERREMLRDIRELLAPQGVLIFSSHNLDYADGKAEARGPGARGGRAGAAVARVARASPERVVRAVWRLPGRIRNRRSLAAFQSRSADHAIINDSERNYGVLHYYIGRDAQARQLADVGLELLECLDVEGRRVPAGAIGYGPWLHYVARPA